MKAHMKNFKRGLSVESMRALQKLAASSGDNWWKEVLGAKDLLLAVRSGYLNAYVKGQSVFKIAFENSGDGDDQPRLAIHYKYLIKPELAKKDPYVVFDGKKFAIDPSEIVHTVFESKLTLPQLIKTAARFSGAEKAGVHKIAQNEPKVIDLEVAFTATGESESPSAPRMDIAVLVPNKRGGASLVFCEAKCFDNKELSSLEGVTEKGLPAGVLERRISVVAQLQKYEAFIGSEANNELLVKSYIRVCKTLMDISRQHPGRKVDELVQQVADGDVKLSIHPEVFLLVYDFSDDHKQGSGKKLLAALRDKGIKIIAKGKASDFLLSKDILRISPAMID
jgi:hypothetical protein